MVLLGDDVKTPFPVYTEPKLLVFGNSYVLTLGKKSADNLCVLTLKQISQHYINHPLAELQSFIVVAY